MNTEDIILDTRFITFILCILLPYLLYRFSTRNHAYWKERGVPYVKPYPFIGSYVQIFKKNIEDLDLDRHRTIGRIYGVYEATKPQIVVAEPEIIGDILEKDFHFFTSRRDFQTGDEITDKMMSLQKGDDWKRIRMIMAPTFSNDKIDKVMDIFKDSSTTLVQNLKSCSALQKSVEVSKFYGTYSMDVIASAAFSTKIDSYNEPNNEFITKAKAIFAKNFGFRFLFFLLFYKLLKFFKIRICLFDSASLYFFKKVTLEIIHHRKTTGEIKNDFLQLLINASSEVEQQKNSKGLSMNELVSQCVGFFLVGYHTITSSLEIITYLMAIYQDEQEKLFQEINEIIKENNGKLTYDSVQKMKYLDNIISEALRLYSPAVRLERTAEAEYKLRDTGITIPKGMVVSVPVFAIHKDPEFFPDPERFNPDRFSSEEREKHIPYSYLPFGAGPRNCIGIKFALMELKVCLVHIFSTFHIKICPETLVPIQFDKGQGILRPKSIVLQLDLRESCPLKI